MYCKNCGTKIPDKAAFCPNCGTGAAPSPAPGPTREDIFRPAKAPRKRWLLPVLIAAAVVAAAILLIVLLSGRGGAQAAKNVAIYAKISEKGTAYIPLMDGSCIKIDDDVRKAAITQDRKNVIVLQEDGTLYVTNPKLSKETEVADDVEDFSYIRSDGIIYTDTEDVSYRYLFGDKEPVKLGELDSISAADNSISVVYALDGTIYTLSADSEKRVKVGTEDVSVSVKGISDDGKLCLWVDSSGSTHTIRLSDNGEKTTLGTVESKYEYTYLTFSSDQKVATVVNSYCENMWVIRRGQEPVKVKLGAEPQSATVYTPNGPLSRSTSGDASDLYMLLEADEGGTVYHVSPDGDRERVVSRVNSMEIAGGWIVYLDTDENLRCAKLAGENLEEETLLAKDVQIFEVSSNGQYVYYAKCTDEKEGTLYCVKTGEDSPERIDTEIHCWNWQPYISMMYIDISADGKTVFYFKDAESIGDTYRDEGTLMMWTYGSDDSVEVSENVIVFSVNSGISGGVDPQNLMFMKCTDCISSDVYGNWMYFNGKEAKKIASNLLY